MTTFAGGGLAGDVDGIGTAASLSSPFGIAQSGDTLYVTDGSRNNIRTIDINTARVGTIVTSRLTGGYVNGAGTSARFNAPRGVVVTGGGTLYVADFGNHLIREVRAGANAAATQVSLLAGTINMAGTTGTAGHANGAGTSARFNAPIGLAVSGTTLYVADYSNNRIRAIDLAIATNTVSTIAGSGTAGYADGVGTAAQFNAPIGLAVSGTTLYIADYDNHRIRAIDLASATRTVSTIAGDGTSGGTNGIGTAARFSRPNGIAVSDGTTLYVSATAQIRKLEYREVD